MSKTQVLHIIHSLTAGGAARTMIATAKYSAELGPFQHKLAILDLTHTDPAAARFAIDEGMELAIARNLDEIRHEMELADIVQVNWWQHPEMDLFLRSALPECRLLGWLHVAGDKAPQVITSELVEQLDLALGGSEYSWHAPGIQAIPEPLRSQKTGFVVGGADFARLDGLAPRAHAGFNVGYIGTVNFVKMHPDYLALHGGIEIPGLRVVVCGGDLQNQLTEEAAQHGWGETFDFRGYVGDIRPVLEELDVYGYPLCLDTYAASELNLQEAMFAGIPPVVFPHGGIQLLVKHNETGLVVHSNQEYRDAIAYLYNNPSERLRLGANAAEYSKRHFGARSNAPKMNQYYAQLLQQPKRARRWRGYELAGVLPEGVTGLEVFLESLGNLAPEFLESLHPSSLQSAIRADELIVHSSQLMRLAATLPYRATFPDSAELAMWGGLSLFREQHFAEAAQYLLFALQSHQIKYPERLFWYLAISTLR